MTYRVTPARFYGRDIPALPQIPPEVLAAVEKAKPSSTGETAVVVAADYVLHVENIGGAI